MGVPAFFRWLSRKYPSVIVYCNEDKPQVINGVTIPVDSSKPNSNNVEFDNLYLDMNGIIHPCTHPEDKPAPKDEDEMMLAIFQCIDRLFSIVRPRKLLYMAIDGVAPRAKMNQQRSRRFRASKETNEKIKEMADRRRELLGKGAYLPPEKPKEAHFDSNCITPGTPFMARLSACLHYYIHDRLNNDPGWKNIKVILSDANVPGEGEHKIMDYIRRQRAQPDHDPNTQHVLCGADADLIMLGLATHEPNFTIIREEFQPNKARPCDLCSQMGHEMKDCVGCAKPAEGAEAEPPVFGGEVPFIFVRLCVLREYLKKDLQMPNLPFPYDFERVIDDWVFMCFFVGNDFLPHLPSLEIREGAIDRLVELYKNCVHKTGGFVTDSGNVNLARVQLILSELGKVEDEIFKKRQQTELYFRQREKNRKRFAAERDGRPSGMPTGQYAPAPLGRSPSVILNPRQEAYQGRVQGMHSRSNSDSAVLQGDKRKLEEDEDEDEDAHDEVRLWEDGFKDRYYESKFDVKSDNIEFRIKVGHQYVRGLCWVLRYYYQGCASWSWYFPYHYAPFASDFVNVSEINSDFDRNTKPFQPLEQLMCVFPAASSNHVPKPWAELMHNPSSPIIDFYPVDFKIDLNGKKFAWQGVALLPFVDEKRMFKALDSYYEQLTPAERKRNTRGDDRLYVGPGNSGFSFFKTLYEQPGDDLNLQIDLQLEGIRGKILLASDCVALDGQLASPVRGLSNLYDNNVICIRFRDPIYPISFIFPAKRLKGAEDPPAVLKPGDLPQEQNRNWRPQIGMTRGFQRAGLSASGHRTVDFHVQSSSNRGISEGVSYAAVPPPTAMPLMGMNPASMQAPYHRGMQTSSYSDRRNDRSDSRYQSSQSPRSRSSYPSQNQGGYPRQEHGGYQRDQEDRGGYRSGYQSQDRGHQQQDRGGYQQHNRGGGGYQQRDRGGSDERDRGGYQQRDRGGSDERDRGGYQRQNRSDQELRGFNTGGGYRQNNQDSRQGSSYQSRGYQGGGYRR